MEWPDLSDEAIRADLVEASPRFEYCLVKGLIRFRNSQGCWLILLIEDDAEADATKDYLRRVGVPEFESDEAWAEWVRQREAEQIAAPDQAPKARPGR